MWNLLCQRLLSLVSYIALYSDYTCFLSSLSPDASCYRYHNNTRDFHRGMVGNGELDNILEEIQKLREIEE